MSIAMAAIQRSFSGILAPPRSRSDLIRPYMPATLQLGRITSHLHEFRDLIQSFRLIAFISPHRKALPVQVREYKELRS